jgi:hypothetical protein
MDTGMILMAFRWCLYRKGLTLTLFTNYVKDHIEELPNELLQEILHDVEEEYDHGNKTQESGFLTAKRLVTAIRRELYGNLEDEE